MNVDSPWFTLRVDVPVLLPTLMWALGVGVGYYLNSVIGRAKYLIAENNAKKLTEETKREAENILREAQFQAKDEILKARESFEKDSWARRQDLIALEERINQREMTLDRKVGLLDKKEQSIDQKIADAEKEKENYVAKKHEYDRLIDEERDKLQRISGLAPEEAKHLYMHRLEDDLKGEAGKLMHRIQEDTKLDAEKEARKIITVAIERYAADQVNEMTTSTVTLPSDEMKGRIIGKEGRNIRSLEAATGVNILIDDTPEVVVISSFDPLRREIAKQTLERLITDGRIHPTRIEEIVAKVQSEMEETIRAAGEAATYELGLQGVDVEVIKLLGRLKFRHSYGQNVLKHSVEMGHIMGMMAAELKLDPMIAKRAGLFHDIGKALEHSVEGGHAVLGAEFIKRHGETPVVVNAVASHHNDVEAESLYAILVKAADAMTAARPGARSDNTEIYLKRLEKLEELANGFRGVSKSYAIQAGREIRVIVEPTQIDDNESMQLARNLSKQIEQELEYPGQIKITVVRETRCIEYAR